MANSEYNWQHANHEDTGLISKRLRFIGANGELRGILDFEKVFLSITYHFSVIFIYTNIIFTRRNSAHREMQSELNERRTLSFEKVCRILLSFLLALTNVFLPWFFSSTSLQFFPYSESNLLAILQLEKICEIVCSIVKENLIIFILPIFLTVLSIITSKATNFRFQCRCFPTQAYLNLAHVIHSRLPPADLPNY